MPQLSIITVCYNEPNLVKTCESIVNQTWQDFEWIVVDGGSNVEIQVAWNQYKNRINKFISESDRGVYDAMNKGINLASGKYLLFLNAGDFLYENTVLEKIFKDREYITDILYGNINLVLDDNPTYIDYLPNNINKEFLYISTIRHQASFIKKSLFDKYGLYDESYKIVADYEKWFVFLENNSRFEYIPYIISSQDMNGLSQNFKNKDIAFKERKDVINKNFTTVELKRLENKYKSFNMSYSLGENLFSIKNNYNKSYKVFTFLGCHFYFERRQKSDVKNNVNIKECIIVIPCYKKNITKEEQASLIQCVKVLKKWDICLIAPIDLNLESYTNLIKKLNKNVSILRFSNEYFKSVESYSQLMLNIDFYKSFNNYKYMLIYQLDAWVFDDKLKYWCTLGFDYIGAPWFENYAMCDKNSKLLEYCGNGGFSLRNIPKICKLLSKNYHAVKKLSIVYRENQHKNFITNLMNYPLVILKWLFQKERFLPVWKITNLNEDGVITDVAKKIYPDFKIAKSEEAIAFAFECNPDVLYEMNNNKLPFGCHAYKKYNWNFWKNYIDIENNILNINKRKDNKSDK